MNELIHSAKGSTWKNHKYTAIRIVNGKKQYIYDTMTEAGSNLSWDSKAARAKAVIAAQNKKRTDEYKESIKKQKKEKQVASATRKRGNPERTVKETATSILKQQERDAAVRRATTNAFNKGIAQAPLPGPKVRNALNKVRKKIVN